MAKTSNSGGSNENNNPDPPKVEVNNISPDQFAGLIGANKTLRWVINKKYKEAVPVSEWVKIIKRDRLLDKVPKILLGNK